MEIRERQFDATWAQAIEIFHVVRGFSVSMAAKSLKDMDPRFGDDFAFPVPEVTVKTAIRVVLVLTILVIANSAFAAQVSIGIRIGPPPPPRVMAVVPVSPGPEFVWVGGYWYPVGPHWRWHAGYWTRAPYAYARWVTPRYESGVYFAGYWQGERGRIEHDHRWDRAKERDFRGRGKGRGR